MLTMWDQGRHKKTRLRLLDALSNCRGNIHGKKRQVPKQDTRRKKCRQGRSYDAG